MNAILLLVLAVVPHDFEPSPTQVDCIEVNTYGHPAFPDVVVIFWQEFAGEEWRIIDYYCHEQAKPQQIGLKYVSRWNNGADVFVVESGTLLVTRTWQDRRMEEVARRPEWHVPGIRPVNLVRRLSQAEQDAD